MVPWKLSSRASTGGGGARGSTITCMACVTPSSLRTFFFFQAEDGIRGLIVTGVQTCALPIFSPLQHSFDITGTTGIPGALNDLYSAFSAWSTSPNDGSARQGVLTAAQSVSRAFQQQGAVLDQAASDADSQLTGLVDHVNQLAATIQQNNVQRSQGNGKDPSLDVGLYNAV